jgi:hypothetical protein
MSLFIYLSIRLFGVSIILYDENVEKCIKVKEYEDIYYKSEETGISYESMKESLKFLNNK